MVRHAERRRHRRGFTLIELLIGIAIIAILMSLILAGVQRVRESAARLKCQNNVKQIALAMHQFHDSKGVLPPGHRSLLNFDLMPFSGWPVSVLPDIEQQPLADAARAAYRKWPLPWFDPPHTDMHTVVPGFNCPSDDRVVTAQVSMRTHLLVAFTSYLGVSGRDSRLKDGVLFQDSKINFLAVTDGTSSTLLLGERPPSADFQFGWWYAGIGQRETGSGDMILGVREPNLMPIVSGSKCGPGNYPFMPATGFDDPCGVFHFWSPHRGGANFAFCDASVRFLSYSAYDLMPALASRAGGEVVAVPD
jgi:prepilin-type N-terminal cleavage/methylation domain-containing protein/prepilin-type processing-associated H-X9-DG protein